MSSGRKQIKDLVRDLESEGFTVTRRGSGHYAVTNPDGQTVFMPHSPSDSRGIHRVYVKLKSIGYQRRRK